MKYIRVPIPDDTEDIRVELVTRPNKKDWFIDKQVKWYNKEQLASMIVKDERSNNSGD